MDELLRAPHSVEAEQAVLGSMLLDPKRIPNVISLLTADDFFLQTHRDIFQAIAAMFDAGEKIDPIILRDKLPGDDIGEYIERLLDITPTSANILHYAEIVRNKVMLRTMQKTAQETVQLIADGAAADEVQAAVQRVQDASTARETVEAVNMVDATRALIGELEARKKKGGTTAGLITGYTELDTLIGGLQTGNMIVLAARSGMGKSALALNIATETAKLNRCAVLFFSLEMNGVELAERVYSNYARVDLNRIRDARLSDEEWCRLGETAVTVSEYAVRIVEAPSLGMMEITRICRREKPALIILDHIGLVRPTGKCRDRREAVDAISRAIKCLAKDLGVPILSVAQLNRSVMSRANKRPVLSDLRESGAIEQDADTVLLLHRPAYYDASKNKAASSLIVAKNRHGRTGTVPLLWYGSQQRFVDDWTREPGDEEEGDPP
jgi:replicative DNA helicase